MPEQDPPANPHASIPAAPRIAAFRLPAPYAARPAAWLITFADLLSLILVFFVLMFSANAVQMSEWQKLVTSLSDRLNPAAANLRETRSDTHPHLKAPVVAGREIAWLETLFSEKLGADPVLRDSRLRNLGDRLAISVPADLLFRRDGDRLADPAAFDAMARLAGLLRDLDNRVAVVAYTDPRSAEGAGAKAEAKAKAEARAKAKAEAGHWDLSLRRAVTVARILEQNGYGRPVEIFGHGAPPFDGLMAGLPLDMQSRLSRRIDLVIREYERVGTP